MAKKGTRRLGDRLKSWVSAWWHETTVYGIWDSIRDYVVGCFNRWIEILDNPTLFWYGDKMNIVVAAWVAIVLDLLYIFTGIGKEQEPRYTPQDVGEETLNWFEEQGVGLMNKWLALAESDAIRGTTDTLGTMLLDPVLDVLLPPPGTEEIDGKDTAERFTGLILGLPLSASLLDTAYSWLPLDGEADFEGATRSAYWALGLGFLGWQSLSPALRIALQDPMERYYNKQYRPERFSLSTLLDLYLLGAISAGDLYERGAELGWRPEDMRLLVEEAQSLPSRADLRRMRDQGLIDLQEHREWLKKLGYRAPAINYILQIDQPEVEEVALKTYRSTIKNAYEEGLIDAVEFRTHAEDLNWSATEIDLQLALLDLERENELKSLAKSDVETAYKKGVLTRNDARNILQANEFSPQAIDHLLTLWDAELAEPARRITSGNVQAAIVQGVLDPERGKQLLIDTGYPEADAQVIVRTAVEQRQRSPREATVGAYIRAFRKGLIELDDFREGLRAIGYSERAIKLYTNLAQATQGEGTERVTESKALRLYRYGRWTHEETLQWLLQEGYTQERATDLIWLEARRIEEEDVVSAFRQGFIEQEEAVDRLVAIGYTPASALEALGERERRLSKGDVLGGLILGLFNVEAAQETLVSIGYSEEDARFLVVSELFAVGVEEVLRGYREDRVSRQETQARLRVLGYGREQARTLIEEAVLLPSRLEVLRAHKVGLLTIAQAVNSLTLIGLTVTEAKAVLQTSVREAGEQQVYALWDRGLITEAEALDRLELVGYSRSQAREKLREERE